MLRNDVKIGQKMFQPNLNSKRYAGVFEQPSLLPIYTTDPDLMQYYIFISYDSASNIRTPLQTVVKWGQKGSKPVKWG